jgi:hypothetical protein
MQVGLRRMSGVLTFFTISSSFLPGRSRALILTRFDGASLSISPLEHIVKTLDISVVCLNKLPILKLDRLAYYNKEYPGQQYIRSSIQISHTEHTG